MYETADEVYANVLPLLQASNWPGAIRFPGRPLFAHEAHPQMPWVAFCLDHTDRVAFLTFDQMNDLRLSPEGVEEHASRNLRRRSGAWQLLEIPLPHELVLEAAALTGDFFCAEQILEEDALRAAAKRLGAETLAVGVPRRGVLIATDADQPQREVAAFSLIVASQFHQAETTPISPLMLGLDGTTLLSVLDGRLLYADPG